jgi:hypothetical protein
MHAKETLLMILLLALPASSQLTYDVVQNSQTAPAGGTATYTINVRNNGTTPVPVNFTTSGVAGFFMAMEYRSNPIPSGGSSDVKVIVTSRSNLPPQSYPIQVVAKPAGASQTSIPLTFVVTNVSGHGQRCSAQIPCTSGQGLTCKPSGRYGSMERYCCFPGECASVISGNGSHCVGNGGTDQVDTPGGTTYLVCSTGVWTTPNNTCTRFGPTTPVYNSQGPFSRGDAFILGPKVYEYDDSWEPPQAPTVMRVMLVDTDCVNATMSMNAVSSGQFTYMNQLSQVSVIVPDTVPADSDVYYGTYGGIGVVYDGGELYTYAMPTNQTICSDTATIPLGSVGDPATHDPTWCAPSSQYGQMCNNMTVCGGGLQCKPSGRYGSMERYCCQPNQCASVIPYPGVSHCVGDGGTDQPMMGGTVVCVGGLWVNQTMTQPDLATYTPTLFIYPAYPTERDTIRFSTYAKNIGNGSTGPWAATLNVAGSQVDYGNYSSMPANSPYLTWVEFNKQLNPGTYEVQIVLDPFWLIEESDESNNVASAFVTVKNASGAGQPDLVPDQVNHILGPTPGTHMFNTYVWNRGNVSTGPWSAGLYVNGALTDTAAVVNTPAGSYSYVGFLRNLSAGIYTIKIMADYSGAVVESNESNNERTITVNASNPGTTCPDNCRYYGFADGGCEPGLCPTNTVDIGLDGPDYGHNVCSSGEWCCCTYTPQYTDTCTDSDGGNYPATKGSAYGYLNGTYYNGTDYCFNGARVIEYYCQSGGTGMVAASSNIDCNAFVPGDYCSLGICRPAVTSVSSAPSSMSPSMTMSSHASSSVGSSAISSVATSSAASGSSHAS